MVFIVILILQQQNKKKVRKEGRGSNPERYIGSLLLSVEIQLMKKPKRTDQNMLNR